MAQIMSQMDQRRPVKYKDQHGRAWFAEVEKSTGQPCIPLQPEFVAPIVPPKKYVHTDLENLGRVVIEYKAWIKDLQDADRNWWRQAQIYGAQEHKEHFNPDAPFSQTVLNKSGERPRVHKTKTPFHVKMGQAALPAIYAMRGNLWILGLPDPQGRTPKCPTELEPFFAKPLEEEMDVIDEFEGEMAANVVMEAPKRRGRPPKDRQLASVAAEG